MRNRSYRLEIVFLGIAASILIYQLLIPPIVGLANSGDFPRLMKIFGLSFTSNDVADIQYLFVNKHFYWDKSIHAGYPSSELLFIGTALLASLPFANGDLFDIRFLGAVHIISFLMVLFILTRYAAYWPLSRKLVLYVLVALIFTDVGYAAYFNSLYSETASVIFLGASIAIALSAAAKAQPDKRGLLIVVAFFAASLLLVTAKFQNVLMAVPLAFVGYRLRAVVAPKDDKRGRGHRKIAAVLTVMLLAAAAGYYSIYAKFSDKIRPTNLYVTVFYEILDKSPDPKADAKALGLDESASEYAGKIETEIPEDIKQQIRTNLGYADILKFYISRPNRLIALMSRSAKDAFSQRPFYLGNFEKEKVMQNYSGPSNVDIISLPQEFFSSSFAYWSSFKARFVPKSLRFVVLFVLLNCTAALIKWIKYDRTARDKFTSELYLALIVMAVIQFFTVTIGEGSHELMKHLFLFNLLCDVSFIFLILFAVSGITALRQSKLNNAAGMV